ncbi:unnamed protein product, partial [Didymodactylos carnosus]
MTLRIPFRKSSGVGFEEHDIRLHRTWNVGDDKLINWRLLDTPKAIGHLQCQSSSSKPQWSSITPVSKERKALSDRCSITTTTTVESAAQANRKISSSSRCSTSRWHYLNSAVKVPKLPESKQQYANAVGEKMSSSSGVTR